MDSTSYARAAIEAELARVHAAGPGSRARTLFRSAAALGQLVGGGELDESEAEARLLAAALRTGLTEREAVGHIGNGLRRGSARPRTTPARRGSTMPTSRRPLLRTTPEPPPRLPPPSEVEALWRARRPVTQDAAVAEHLHEVRGLDPDKALRIIALSPRRRGVLVEDLRRYIESRRMGT